MFGFGVPELIVILGIVGFPLMIYVAVKKGFGKRSENIDEGYRGVSGWLLLFCLSLTVFGPVISICSTVVYYSQFYQYFDPFPGLFFITVIDIILTVVLMSFSIYAGVKLWRVRQGAVQTAKKYLFCFLAYQVVAAVLPFMAGLPAAANNAMIAEVAKDIFRGIIYFVIWYSYLNTSQRVRATYEKAKEENDQAYAVDRTEWF